MAGHDGCGVVWVGLEESWGVVIANGRWSLSGKLPLIILGC